MKLAISNIAWPAAEEAAYIKYVSEWGCAGIEIAPSRIWPEPLNASRAERRAFKSLVEKFGLKIPSLHALLFNRPDLGIFRGPEVERQTVGYLKGLCQLAADLEARVLVFGSPRNRQRGEIPMEEAFATAAAFFAKVAPMAGDLGVCVCIEPLRPEETDFVFSVADGLRLVEMVSHPGFGLHLDAKAVSAEGGDLFARLQRATPKLEHFHINDPNLTEISSSGTVPHGLLAQALQTAGYQHYVSIEMRCWPDHYQVINRSIEFSRKTYLGL